MFLKRIKDGFHIRRFVRKMSNNRESLALLCKHLDINKEKAYFITLKQPYITKLCEEDMNCMIQTVYELGFSKDILIDHPTLFHLVPITFKNRYKILEECGFKKITPELVLSYLNVIKQKTVGELKNRGLILPHFNIENRLASCLTQWPQSLTTFIVGDINSLTLYSLRINIIQRYLELMLDLSKEEFIRGLKSYPTLQHRPLRAINETLVMLQSQIAMPNYKIKSNLYLIHADPDNLQKLLYQLKELGGIDIREVIRMYPRLAAKNYSTILEINNVFERHGINPEAQTRCFQIFTLSPKTVEERLNKAKLTPEFSLYVNHPRFLKMILYNKTVLKRMTHLNNNNKKCLSLNVLSGSSRRYNTFEKTPGDRLGKGKDLVFTIRQILGSKFSSQNIRNSLKRHPFWINIPLIEVKYVCDKLEGNFSKEDIFENVSILLYPWNKIKQNIEDVSKQKKQESLKTDFYPCYLDFKVMTKSQQLSLVLYMIEKDHYFSGNGVWTEDQQKNINLMESKNFIKYKRV